MGEITLTSGADAVLSGDADRNAFNWLRSYWLENLLYPATSIVNGAQIREISLIGYAVAGRDVPRDWAEFAKWSVRDAGLASILF